MKKTTWWIVGALAAIVLVILIGKINGNKGIEVEAESVGRATVVETVTASGKIYPETEVKISPEVSGEIIELTVNEGDSVTRGQLLVKINPAIYTSLVNQAAASVAQSRASARNAEEMTRQAQSQYDLALATFERNKQLFQEKVISKLEFEQAEASYKSALAAYEAARASASGGGFGVEAAQANLQQAQENLRRTTILAPVSGVISQLNVKKGERMVGTAQMAGTEMLTIADMSRIEVRVNVSEIDIVKVKTGDTADIEADAYRGRIFKGVVSKVAVSSAGGTTTTSASTQINTDQVTNYVVHILILPETYADLEEQKKPGGFVFKPGMSASVSIRTRIAEQTLAIPVNAVTTRDWPDSVQNTTIMGQPRQVVFVLNAAKQTVELRDVQTGLQDDRQVQILDGLQEGEKVITAPYGAIARLLKDGTRVTVVDKLKKTPTTK